MVEATGNASVQEKQYKVQTFAGAPPKVVEVKPAKSDTEKPASNSKSTEPNRVFCNGREIKR